MIKVDGPEIEKYEFHQYKSPILITNIDINKKVVSNKLSFGKQNFKCFIGYKDNKETRPLCMFFLEMSINKKFLIIYMIIWEKVSNIIKTNFNSELIQNKSKH